MDRDPVIDRLVGWIQEQPAVRAGLITSTRAVPHLKTDELSDYDVILVVTNIEPYVEDRGWIETFGNVLVSYWDPIEIDDDTGAERSGNIIQYDDGLKIDFTLWSIDGLRHLTEQPVLPLELDAGYRVIADKDGLASKLPAPTYRGYRRYQPSEAEYQQLVNDFFVGPPYVAKCLIRNELLPAKWCLDYDMRFVYALPMLEWRAQCDADWSLSFGVNGKGLRRHLPEHLWTEFELTFAGGSIRENWDSLFGLMSIFGSVAREVAESLGYRYPDELDRRVTEFVRAMHSTHTA
jgi:aminoglycoside 6-adenylyltransferase